MTAVVKIIATMYFEIQIFFFKIQVFEIQITPGRLALWLGKWELVNDLKKLLRKLD